ncbi:MAG: phage tail sheath family protein [Paenibacillus dendritiformis]|uniref:phage tail sheath family protein n=1 Tax=uncultured Paenibacillus sp. TaxID=227322 RepID=UPI0025DD4916|nr:phage tail sheath family protein [uncultured Paenibacillus sp.]MDU5141064.1 phage tail sheath family protein [Paenibacillus dendritiformis]
MAGGVWTTQNKTRTGVYINFVSEASPLGSVGERGIAAFPASLPWGNPGLIILDAATYMDEALPRVGFHAGDGRIRHITAALAHARRVLIYRLGAQGAAKATVTIGKLTATAKWAGLRGNDLSLVVRQTLDDEDTFEVLTLLEGEEVDRQTAGTVEELTASDFIDWSGTGALTASAGAPLTGGTAGTATGGEYSAALAAFEPEDFNVLGIPVDDLPTKQLAVSYVKRLRDEGKKVVAVVVGYPDADHEGVISLKNSVVTTDGLTVEPTCLLWEIAGMTAAAGMNQSLTYQSIPGAVDAHPRLSNAETEQALRNGELVITASDGRAYIEQDINTLTSFTPEKGRPFSKNRVIRVLDSIANDLKRIFELYYLGKVSNDADGRSMLRSEMVTYLESLQSMRAIQNFDPQRDIFITMGTASDSVYVELAVQPVDAIEKIYMKVTVR